MVLKANRARRVPTFNLFSFRNPTLWIAVPLLVYAFLRVVPLFDPNLAWIDPTWAYPTEHFSIVSVTALVALVVSATVGIVGMRQRNIQVIYVSLAFISLAGFFSIHGLATPHFIIGDNSVVGVAAQLSVLTMSLWLLVSSLPADNAFSAYLARYSNWLVPVYVPAIVLIGVLALSNPSVADLVPVTNEPIKYISGGLTIVLASAAGYRYWQSFRYSNFPFQVAIALTGGWIAVTQIIITTALFFHASWWIYHFLLLFSVIAVVAGLVVQYRRGDSIVRSILGLFSTDPSERLEAGLSPSVRSLIEATEARDPYTAGHSYRVSRGAFELGNALKVSPEELRVLVQGGLVHDVGKLEVPGTILNKPGPLTAEERKAIEDHPVIGYDLCARLGFMAPELAVIRSHHERLDGAGYPDGLANGDIPRLARILSVIDVWDALTSARAYRLAWSEAEALAYLQENCGTQFDADLVDTWVNVVKANGKTK